MLWQAAVQRVFHPVSSNALLMNPVLHGLMPHKCLHIPMKYLMVFGHGLDLNKYPHPGPLAAPNAKGRFQRLPSIDEHLTAVVPTSSLGLLSLYDGERGTFSTSQLYFGDVKVNNCCVPARMWIDLLRKVPCKLKYLDFFLSSRQHIYILAIRADSSFLDSPQKSHFFGNKYC